MAKSTKDNEVRVLLEFHTLIGCNDNRTNTDFGCGPFAAVATTQEDVIGGIGIGWLWSWRNKAKTDGSGFSIGLGAILDNDVKDLADGFRVGSPPPAGEAQVRYTSESRTSYLLFLSNNFSSSLGVKDVGEIVYDLCNEWSYEPQVISDTLKDLRNNDWKLLQFG